MQLLNTLYVTEDAARVAVSGDALEVRNDNQLVGRFPLHGLEAVTLVGHASMTTEAIARCVEHRVRVAVLSNGGKVRFVASGGTSGNIHLRLAQYQRASDDARSLALAKLFIAAKLQNQRRAVQRWAWDADPATRRFLGEQLFVIDERLRAVPGSTSGDHVRGLEGDAARRYFKALGAHLYRVAPDFPLVRRSRRPPNDPANCLLSFLYALTLTEIVGALEATGLDPQLGFLHGARPGRPSLALDLLEELRPSVCDRLAVALLARKQLRLEHFESVGDRAWFLNDAGRRTVFKTLYEYRREQVLHPVLNRDIPRGLLPGVQATLLARHLRGDLPTYAPFVG